MNVAPVNLEGRRVRMEPLELPHHFEGLCAIGLDPELWRWTINVCATPDQLREYLDTALAEQREGRSLPFAVASISSCTTVKPAARALRRAFASWPCRRRSVTSARSG